MTLNQLREACNQDSRFRRERNVEEFGFENLLDFDEGDEEIMPNRGCNTNTQTSCNLPGTILKIFIPAGAVINLLGIIELASPTGICVILRSPLLAGIGGGCDLSGIANTIRQAGGTVNFVN